MSVYFLVEGRRTEAQVYPAWLTELLPSFRRVHNPQQVTRHCYCLVSASGYPSVVQETLKNAIADVNDNETFSHLVVCLDADNFSVEERLTEVHQIIDNARKADSGSWRLRAAELKFIIQHRTIETWFLGNRRMISDAPQRDTLRRYLAFHDVREHDPELMKLHPGYDYHADFHHDYLKEVFQERGISYRKRDPGHVTEKSYLEQLLVRIANRSQDLKSFRNLVDLCREVERLAKL